jgi:hypothetical protein
LCWPGQLAVDKEKKMTEQYKNKQKHEMPSFDISSCMEMMQKMMGEHMEGCDCAEMMSQVTSREDIPEEWLKVGSQMMEMHCCSQGETVQDGYEA